jgi:hypothetical protein
LPTRVHGLEARHSALSKRAPMTATLAQSGLPKKPEKVAQRSS